MNIDKLKEWVDHQMDACAALEELFSKHDPENAWMITRQRGKMSILFELREWLDNLSTKTVDKPVCNDETSSPD